MSVSRSQSTRQQQQQQQQHQPSPYPSGPQASSSSHSLNRASPYPADIKPISTPRPNVSSSNGGVSTPAASGPLAPPRTNSDGRGRKRKSAALELEDDQMDSQSTGSVVSEDANSVISVGGYDRSRPSNHPSSSQPLNNGGPRASYSSMPVHLMSPNSNHPSSPGGPSSHHLGSRQQNGAGVHQSLELPPIMDHSAYAAWNANRPPPPPNVSSPHPQSHAHLDQHQRASPFPTSLGNPHQLASISSPHLAPMGSGAGSPHPHLPPIPNTSSSSASHQHPNQNRLPPLATSLYGQSSRGGGGPDFAPMPSPSLTSTRADLEDLRAELRAGREWMEGMLARTEAGLRDVEEQLRRQDVASGGGKANGNGTAADANGAVRLNRPGGGGGRREKLWGLENGH